MRTPVNPVGLLVLAAIALTACNKPAEETKSPAPAAEATAGAEASQAAAEPGVVALASDSQKLVGLQTSPVERRTLRTTLTTTGEIAPNGDREAHVNARVAGRVLTIKKSIGDWAAAGETLATVESVDLGQAQAEYLQAQSREELARSQYERQRRLFEAHLNAKKDVQEAENGLRMADIDLERTANQLKLLGMAPARIRTLVATRQLDPTIPLIAPIAGVVTARHLTIGEMLEPNPTEPAFSLSDTSELWVNADVYEQDLGRVHAGQAAAVTTSAFPGRIYRARVSQVSSTLDKETRTAKARIVVANADRKLKPEMFAEVRIDVGDQSVLVVPKAAVQEENKRKIVYVPLGPEKFKEVTIKVGTEYPTFYQVTSGLQSGDTVVTKGSYDLMAQARKSTFAGED